MDYNTANTVYKYNQVRILICEDSDCPTGYNRTTLPAFEDIDIQLYETRKDNKIYHYIDEPDFEQDVGEKIKYVSCDTKPIIHHNEIPTLREVLNQIPYKSYYDRVCLYIQPHKYMVGSYYVSTLHYARPANVVENRHIFVEDTMVTTELNRRYNAVTPVYKGKCEDGKCCNIIELEKPEFSKMSSHGYTRMERGHIIGKYNVKTRNIMTNDGEIYAQYVATIPTFHVHGLFKPTMDEVLLRIPDEIINEKEKLIITTEVAIEDVYKMCIGKYHVCKTTIWRRCIMENEDENIVEPKQIEKDETETKCIICMDAVPDAKNCSKMSASDY